MYICIIGSITCLVPSHYLNLCWFIVNFSFIFKNMHWWFNVQNISHLVLASVNGYMHAAWPLSILIQDQEVVYQLHCNTWYHICWSTNNVKWITMQRTLLQSSSDQDAPWNMYKTKTEGCFYSYLKANSFGWSGNHWYFQNNVTISQLFTSYDVTLNETPALVSSADQATSLASSPHGVNYWKCLSGDVINMRGNVSFEMIFSYFDCNFI